MSNAAKQVTHFLVSFIANFAVVSIVIWTVHEQNQLDPLVKMGLALVAAVVLSVLTLFLRFFQYNSQTKLAQQSYNLIQEKIRLIQARRYDQAKSIQFEKQSSELTQSALLMSELDQLATKLNSVDEQAAQRIRESHHNVDTVNQELSRVREVINSAQMLIMSVDTHLDIQFFNRYAEQITGRHAKDLLDKGAANLFSPHDWHEMRHHYESLLQGQTKQARQETEIINGAGQIRKIWWLHSLLDDVNEVRVLSIGHDITEQKQVEDRVVWLAAHDALTGLPSIEKFQEQLNDNLLYAKRHDKHHSLFYVHIDFPAYQKRDSSLSAEICDEIRQKVANKIQSMAQQPELVTRLNEQDFVLLQLDTTDASRQQFTDKLLGSLTTLALKTPAKQLPIYVYAGVIDLPYEQADSSELLAFAELAAFRAKHQSSQASLAHVFEVSEQTAADLAGRIYWKKRIQHALDNRQFLIHFQPILDLSNKNIAGYESYLRLLDEETGKALPAGKFIEVAEKQGQAEKIDHFVLQEVCRKLTDPQNKRPVRIMTVNLSEVTLNPNRLLPVIKKLVNHYPAVAGRLILEINEDVALRNVSALKLLMTAIKPLGIRFAIDDFGFDGTVSRYGFSSFSLLATLPIDFVKISGQFIRTLNDNTHDQLFIKTLVEETSAHNVKTIAGCVESEETMSLLTDFGVMFAQGYLIGHPSAQFDTSD
ncbi:diguanylate cyclase/phosphodiesterase (GGDEF & EAL domains) with PAS/PAC sensor(s) [Methylophaga frappieri]|uniref:Diguanylate cyclase/phosphodiesterase (GGDEF & EAL domains) with PAS/PAC sensor(S) n=1 Tax=Methylophaga frappieri (strain ATCC BAA-2434 / DSM 25690 / JAM7) TaxID=754477 RepID=I1YEA0_METFJ|nr:GGDEF domain-containing phosphodiesterase [Methylophaga frappieri]AFJ01243.1 diguanylate cyclase/phosphodiesterase (GGDEF & EAL domains) with PAS/PAC sensor(s) [Methylophaga frappieri]